MANAPYFSTLPVDSGIGHIPSSSQISYDRTAHDDLALYHRISDAVREIPDGPTNRAERANARLDPHLTGCRVHDLPRPLTIGTVFQRDASGEPPWQDGAVAAAQLSDGYQQAFSQLAPGLDTHKRKRDQRPGASTDGVPPGLYRLNGSKVRSKSNPRAVKFKNTTVPTHIDSHSLTRNNFLPAQPLATAAPLRILLERPHPDTGTAGPGSCDAPARKPTKTMMATPAAALYRTPSAASQKHSRAPLAVLCAQLRLPPERFRVMQGRAKAYMLDGAAPERKRACCAVEGGGRGPVELERVVGTFLERGSGEEIFCGGAEGECGGVHEGGVEGENGWVWPRDRAVIVPLVAKLCRRVVGNERQRIYARVVRGKAKGDEEAEKSTQSAE